MGDERTETYALGEITVGRVDEQTTIFFAHEDAHVQVELDTPISDQEIRRVVDSLLKEPPGIPAAKHGVQQPI
ncbi:hypothetical protein LJC33_08500 [Eubacteriales bacterium OttesenSCG-928-N13]|nr:hypothetical protein [Eubacteriales bacterium OttesenSCG-928-N13]